MIGATAKLSNSGTGAMQTVVTDSEGNFRFLLLPPGIYALNDTMNGFKSVIRDGLVVEVGRSLALPISMQLGQVNETVEVSGQSPLLERQIQLRLAQLCKQGSWKIFR